MTGEPPPPTQTIPPGTPDEKLALLIATLLDIILTILEALPIPGFLRRPLQNRARHECAALLTRLLATRVPAPAITPKPAQTPQPPPGPHPTSRAGLGSLHKPFPTPTFPLGDHRKPHPPGDPAHPEPAPEPQLHKTPAPEPRQRAPKPAIQPASLDPVTKLETTRPRVQKFQKPAQAATQTHA